MEEKTRMSLKTIKDVSLHIARVSSKTILERVPPLDGSQRENRSKTPLKEPRIIPKNTSKCSPLVITQNSEPFSDVNQAEASPTKEDIKKKIVKKYHAQNHARELLPYQKRLNACCRIPFSNVIKIHRSESRNTASYRQLEHCSSVWQCPVCAAKISSKRSKEIHSATESCKKNGGGYFMFTLTHSHTREDSLKSLIEKQSSALKSLWNRGSFRRLLKGTGYQGRISSFETTWGKDTGWHPHRHILMFFEKPLSDEDDFTFASALYRGWIDACKKNKLKMNPKYGLKISQWNTDIKSYLSKVHLEMALSDFKQGKKSGRRGAFPMLYDSMEGDKEAGRRFQEFALTMKGKQQICWSPGLKKLFGINDKTDEELNEELTEKDEKPYLDMFVNVWRGVVRNKQRGKLLYFCGKDRKVEINQLLKKHGYDFFFVE